MQPNLKNENYWLDYTNLMESHQARFPERTRHLWEQTLFAQSFVFVDKDEFRKNSPAFPSGVGRRSSGRSGGALPPARFLITRFTWILSFIVSFTILTVSSTISGYRHGRKAPPKMDEAFPWPSRQAKNSHNSDQLEFSAISQKVQ